MNQQMNEKIPNWCLEQNPIKHAIDEYGKRLHVRCMQKCINELKMLNGQLRQLIGIAHTENMTIDDVLNKLQSISQSNDKVISSLIGQSSSIKDTLPENCNDQ